MPVDVEVDGQRQTVPMSQWPRLDHSSEPRQPGDGRSGFENLRQNDAIDRYRDDQAKNQPKTS